MADTVNEEMRDALIRHQVGLQRLSVGLRRRITQHLNATEADLKAEIVKRLARGGDQTSPANIKRLRALETAVTELRKAALDKAFTELRDDMKDLSGHEAEFTATTMHQAAPVTLDIVVPTAQALSSLVRLKPFQGKTLKNWAKKIASDDIHRITNEVRIGMTLGEGSEDIARRVVGTARLAGTDGVTEITRQQASALARTAVNFFSNEAKAEVYKENSDIIKKELYLATLDSRTTVICASLDGQKFPVGEGPRPPMHFNCRSVRVPYFDPVVLGGRPMKRSTEGEIAKEYADKNGLDDVASRDDLPHGHKGSFDDFSRKRVRELTGQAPAETTYQEFLGKQTKAFQEEVLGKTRAKLFRDGDLKLDRFVDKRGNELTIGELAKRERDAFRKAGLNPEDFAPR